MSMSHGLFAALALGMTLGCMVWVLAPLGAEHRRSGGVLAFTVSALTVALYFVVGSPKALDAAGLETAHAQTPPDLQAMVGRLTQRLEAEPTDVEGWFMLARSYQVLEDWNASASAYRKALALAPDDADLLADLADVLGVLADGDLEGEPRALLEKAVRSEPGHAKSLLLLAAAEMRAGRLDQAQVHWTELVRVAPADSQAAAIARDSLQRIGALDPASSPRN